MKQEHQNNDKNNDLNEAIENIAKMQDNLKNNVEEMLKKDSADGEKVEAKDDPIYRLLGGILGNSASILSNPAVMELLNKLTPKIGKEETLSLVQTLSIIMSYSAYSSILLYDDLLKEQIQVEFDHIAKHLNYVKADVSGQQSALEVFKKRLGEVEKKLKIDEIKKNNHVE